MFSIDIILNRLDCIDRYSPVPCVDKPYNVRRLRDEARIQAVQCPTSYGLTRRKVMRYTCDVCGWIYDPETGDPAHGISPGTKFEDTPDDWVCPDCGVGKGSFSVETKEDA